MLVLGFLEGRKRKGKEEGGGGRRGKRKREEEVGGGDIKNCRGLIFKDTSQKSSFVILGYPRCYVSSVGASSTVMVTTAESELPFASHAPYTQLSMS